MDGLPNAKWGGAPPPPPPQPDGLRSASQNPKPAPIPGPPYVATPMMTPITPAKTPMMPRPPITPAKTPMTPRPPMTPPPAAPRPNKPYSQWHWREKRAAVKRSGHRAHNEDSVYKRFAARAQEREAKAVAKLAETTASYQRGLMSAACEVVIAKTERGKDQFVARNREDALQRREKPCRHSSRLSAGRRQRHWPRKRTRKGASWRKWRRQKPRWRSSARKKNEKTRDANDASRRVEVLKNRELNMLRQIKSLED